MVSTERSEGVCQIARPATRWLTAGPNGGYQNAPAAYNVSVPEAWERVDLTQYGADRRAAAGFDHVGPTLFTGVNQQHARVARCDPVTVVATAGLSNPATLPMDPEERPKSSEHGPPTQPGTVNVVAVTEVPLTDGGLATLLATVVEAKTATLCKTAGITGTTTDAVIVGTPRHGEKEPFAGSATAVGSACRAGVRDAIRQSLDSRYEKTAFDPNMSPYGVQTTHRATVEPVQERSGTSGSIE
ncbi:adenosylcobinamide amidohydrolase [Halocatena halophila]|uniref:adenosylcobinamide amidohydrolase n=1 Tax=Halocatena halophila TaxID=2814576 RepID=UPI002ED2A681